MKLCSQHELKGNLDHYVTQVGPEYYYLEYDFKIQAFNNEGYGPNSSEVVIMSAEDCRLLVFVVFLKTQMCYHCS